MTLHAPALLDAHHTLNAFDSGITSFDAWLKRRARANQAGGASRAYVVAQDARVVAYYALASGNIAAREAGGRLRRDMPDPVPVVTLARLAVDRSFQQRGLGRDLVQNAARRVLAAAGIIGIRGIIVHAISDQAKAFYLHCGFVPSPTSEMTLMISLADLRACP
ncbi:MAG: GNAT family N-acetyltransferase [Burkholderiaceae bacterium]|nr:GNAT family N-acetyltransferase [Burkholderiaceae bacterium]